MRGFKPNHKIWKRVNNAIMGENAADVLVTLISGMCSLLIDAGVASDEAHARAHLAAVLISPEDVPEAGSLLPQLHIELAKLRAGQGKWIT